MLIDGFRYTSDLIIIDNEVMDHWRRREGHRLFVPDLDLVFARKPEILIVGSGSSGLMKVDKSVEKECSRLGIRLEARPTAQAVKLFNDLESSGKILAGAFHLTC